MDANVGLGQQLAVTFNQLRVGENVRFDGSAENDGSFLTYGGFGVDEVTGGQQNDGFYFGFGRWGASDRVDGQGGTMDQLGLQGIYTITFGATQIANVEYLALLSGGDTRFGSGGAPYSYNITMNDGNVAAGASFAVSANTLRADETLTFNGSAESNGTFKIFSGLGADVIVGGQGADEIFGGGGNDKITGGLGADLLSGGDGNDDFIYTAVTQSRAAGGIDQICDFATGDRIDLSAIDANSFNGAGTNDAFSFIGAAAFTGGGAAGAGQLRAVLAGGVWTVEGDLDGNGIADFTLLVTIPDTGTSLTAASFVL